MAQASAQPSLARRPLGEMIIDRIWRFFCSVRAAVWEIVALAVLVLIGTLRGSSVPQWIQDALPFTEPIVRRWYAWDVFHSLVFMLLLALISVAIAICTINRIPGIWRTIAHPTVTTSYGFLRSADVNAQYERTGSLPGTVDEVVSAMRKRRYRVMTSERNGEVHIYADRWRYSKLGTFPFHLALILMLVGGIVGAQYGFREMEFIVPEGSIRPVGHGTDVSVGLVDFRDTYYENGGASEYRSELVIYNDGKEVKRGAITVNHPLSYRNMTFYQSSFGQAVTMRVTDDQGRELFNDSIPMNLQSKLNPEAPAGIIELPVIANATIHVIGPDNAPESMPELDTLNLLSGEMFVQVRPKDLPAGTMPPSQVVAQGTTISLSGFNIEFIREKQFTLMQVGNNPGMPIFWTSAFLLVGGLAIVFYFPHRRIRGIIAPSSADSTRVTAMFAPMAKRDWSGQREFGRLCEDLGRVLGTPALMKEPASRRDEEDDGEEPSPVAQPLPS